MSKLTVSSVFSFSRMHRFNHISILANLSCGICYPVHRLMSWCRDAWTALDTWSAHICHSVLITHWSMLLRGGSVTVIIVWSAKKSYFKGSWPTAHLTLLAVQNSLKAAHNTQSRGRERIVAMHSLIGKQQITNGSRSCCFPSQGFPGSGNVPIYN